MGIIRKAMALRVKYRIDHYGQGKRQISIMDMGVHSNNRGGVYPNEERIKQLCVSILQTGCDEADANHNGVVLEELRVEQASRTTD